MDITPLLPPDATIIQSIRKGAVKVKGEWYPYPVIITPTNVVNWDGQDWDALQAETILMGTGDNFIFPPLELRKSAKDQNKNIEWMDNRAAARTYNVLLSEGRDICAAFSEDR